MATVNVVLRDDLKSNDKDEYYLMLRLFHKKIKYPFTFDFKVMKRFWNKETQQVKRTKLYDDYGKWNAEINRVKREAQEVIDHTLKHDPEISANILSNLIRSKLQDKQIEDSSSCFIYFVQQMIQGYKKNGQYSTASNYGRMIKRLKTYFDSENLTYDEITAENVEDYFHWLEYEKPNQRTGEKGLSRNSCHLDYTLFKNAYFNALKEHRHLDEDKNPFFYVESNPERKNIIPLSSSQLEKIKNVKFKKGSNIYHCKYMFLFAIYSGGIRFSDVIQLKWKDIKVDDDGRYLDFESQKTGSPIKTPLLSYAEKILNLYDNKIKKTEEYIFPFGNRKNLDRENPKDYFDFRTSVNASLNGYLKKLSKRAEIGRNLNYHLSRHTYANLLYEAGFSLEEIQYALSQRSKEATLRYLKRIVEFDNRDQRDRLEKATA